LNKLLAHITVPSGGVLPNILAPLLPKHSKQGEEGASQVV
ncbi:MAG: hypothetical protein EZS28_022668, partial [Streblomastix strix]